MRNAYQMPPQTMFSNNCYRLFSSKYSFDEPPLKQSNDPLYSSGNLTAEERKLASMAQSATEEMDGDNNRGMLI